jgi:hypothetical protein
VERVWGARVTVVAGREGRRAARRQSSRSTMAWPGCRG